jgi:hypothetical protein
MSMVRLEFPIASGMKGVSATLYVPVRNLRVEELEGLQGAGDDEIMAVCTGLSLNQVTRLTAQDRAAIIVARRSIT